MPNLETVARRFFADPKWGVKWVIGGVLWLLPLFNLILLGYWLRQVRATDKKGLPAGALPDWDELPALLRDTLRALLIYLVYILLPVLLAAALFGVLFALFNFIQLKLLAWSLAFLPFIPVIALCPALFIAALSVHARSDSFNQLLQFERPLRMVVRALPQLWLPTLALFGLLLIGYPVLPFVAFFGFSLYVGYCTTIFKHNRSTQKNS